MLFEEKSIKKIQDWDLGTLQNMYKIANADIDHLMETKDLQSNSFMSFTNKEFGCSPRHVIGQNYAMKEHPAIVREIERLIKEKGGKIEKSLFDDFIVDVFAADNEEEIDRMTLECFRLPKKLNELISCEDYFTTCRIWIKRNIVFFFYIIQRNLVSKV